MAYLYSTWPPLFVSNGPLGPYFANAGQNTGGVTLILHFCCWNSGSILLEFSSDIFSIVFTYVAKIAVVTFYTTNLEVN